MIEYKATNPYPHNIANASLLPDLNQKISLNILPSQKYQKIDVNWIELEREYAQAGIELDHGNVYTHDDAVVSTVQLTPKAQQKLAAKDKSVVVKFIGNKAHYENLLSMFKNDVEKLHVSVIAFNYRGVGDSKKAPTNFQALVTDGIAQVTRLLEQGINPENITLDGHSLGGAVAIMVASHFHKLDKKVYLFNDRSFSDIASVAYAVLQHFPLVSGIPAGLQIDDKNAIKELLMIEGWEADVAQAYLSIPVQYRRHMYVGSSETNSCGDGVIARSASLHQAVKEQEKSAKEVSGYKVCAQGMLFTPAHTLERAQLRCKKNAELTGFDIYQDFVQRKILPSAKW